MDEGATSYRKAFDSAYFTGAEKKPSRSVSCLDFVLFLKGNVTVQPELRCRSSMKA